MSTLDTQLSPERMKDRKDGVEWLTLIDRGHLATRVIEGQVIDDEPALAMDFPHFCRPHVEKKFTNLGKIAAALGKHSPIFQEHANTMRKAVAVYLPEETE